MIDYRQCREQLKNKPNFLVVGAPKSGTTSLYEYLKQHPEIFVNPEIKETNFFVQPKDVLGCGPRYDWKDSYGINLENYKKLFDNIDNDKYKAIGEVCPTYLPFYNYTIPNILDALGNQVKIIIILRNPIDRAYSHYMHNVRDMDEDLTFEDALQAENERIKEKYWNSFYLTKLGFYFKQVKEYKDNFSDVKIFLFEDLKKESFYQELFEFLNVNSSVVINDTDMFNISGKPKSKFLQKLLVKDGILKSYVKKILKPFFSKGIKVKLYNLQDRLINKNIKKEPMNKDTREKLKETFKDDIEKLSQLINRDLSHWLN